MDRRAHRFAECFSSVPVLLPEQSEVISGDFLLVSCAAAFAPRFMASEYDVLVPGTKAFFDCFGSEVWVGSCFLLGLGSPTTITSSLLETFALLSPPDVLLVLF